jgi:hypothetical protein
MSKLFAFAGTCVENGAVVYKFANDAKRAKALERFGCTEINMIELPFTMAKEAAIDYLNAQGMTAIKVPRGKAPKSAAAKPAPTTKATTDGQVKVSTRRVGDKPRKGQTAEQFAEEWFADRAARVGDRFK